MGLDRNIELTVEEVCGVSAAGIPAWNVDYNDNLDQPPVKLQGLGYKIRVNCQPGR